ncbi:MAG TPA: type II secretion system F family protein [Arthrobacter sp.]
MTTTATLPSAAKAPERTNVSFSFQATTADGKPTRGTVVAPDRKSAISRLTANPEYQSVLAVSETGGVTVSKKASSKPRSLVAFSRQLALCLEVGMEERKAIITILAGGDMEDAVLTHGLNEVNKAMGNGKRMHEAMAAMPYIFPEVMSATLQAGFASGDLKEAALQVADDIEADDDQRARIKKAMTYPTVVLAMSGLIFVFLMVGVVPQFAKLYDNLSGGQASLPGITLVVLAVSNQMFWMVPLFTGLTFLTVFWYKRNSREEKVREFVDPLKLKMPIFGPMFLKVSLTRFCRTYASLSAQLHPVAALEITAASVGNIVMERAILNARNDKLNGKEISESLGNNPIFPKLLLTFIAIGDSTGKSSKALRAIGRLYKRDVDDITNRMEALIQPFFLVLIAAMVLIIALAIYLPYFSIGDIISPY